MCPWNRNSIRRKGSCACARGTETASEEKVLVHVPVEQKQHQKKRFLYMCPWNRNSIRRKGSCTCARGTETASKKRFLYMCPWNRNSIEEKVLVHVSVEQKQHRRKGSCACVRGTETASEEKVLVHVSVEQKQHQKKRFLCMCPWNRNSIRRKGSCACVRGTETASEEKVLVHVSVEQKQHQKERFLCMCPWNRNSIEEKVLVHVPVEQKQHRRKGSCTCARGTETASKKRFLCMCPWNRNSIRRSVSFPCTTTASEVLSHSLRVNLTSSVSASLFDFSHLTPLRELGSLDISSWISASLFLPLQTNLVRSTGILLSCFTSKSAQDKLWR